ncbi:hypothetical protein [Bradyrhizobium sp.]|uniref:hypothetical protein n=1 Tax=Bradyrhizobium sp. TaxID=376 RepID=UPI003C71A098
MAAPIDIPYLEEKFDLLQLHFLVRERFRPTSQHLNAQLEALWTASERAPPEVQSMVTQWGRFLKRNRLPADLAAGLCKMYIGLRPDILMAKTMTEYAALVSAQQSGVEHCKNVLEHYDVHRAELTSLISPYYVAHTANPELPLITRPSWIPKQPIPMGRPGLEPKFVYQASARAPHPPKLPRVDATFHEFRRRLSPQGRMMNDETYRPLEIEVTDRGLHLVCGPGRYFEYHDSCEVLGLELAAWALANPNRRPNSDGSDLPLRGPAENIFNLRNRSAVVGVSTLLIALDYEGDDWYYWYQRGNKVAVNPEAWSVVPSGTFQPFAANLAQHDQDFNIRSTVLRKLAEELLGKEQSQQTATKASDFEKSVLLRDFVSLLNSGFAQLYFLGVGLDPVCTVPEVLTTLIFRANDLPSGTMGKFKNNFEGRYHKGVLEGGALLHFAHRYNVHTASAACMRLTARHLDRLVSEVRHRRHRATA